MVRVEGRSEYRGKRGIAIAAGVIETANVIEVIESGEMDETSEIEGAAANASTRDERGVRGRGPANPRISPMATPSDGAERVSVIITASTHHMRWCFHFSTTEGTYYAQRWRFPLGTGNWELFSTRRYPNF